MVFKNRNFSCGILVEVYVYAYVLSRADEVAETTSCSVSNKGGGIIFKDRSAYRKDAATPFVTLLYEQGHNVQHKQTSL